MLTRAAPLLLLLLSAAPARAYRREEHYATLRLVLASAKVPERDAGLIATCAQLPDESPELSAIDIYRRLMRHPFDYTSWLIVKKGPSATVGRMLTTQQLLHAITGGSSDEAEAAAREIVRAELPALSTPPGPGRADRLCALGFAFHLYADAFSHRMLKNPAKMYETGIGHFFDASKPDFPLYSLARVGAWREYVLSAAALVPRADAASLARFVDDADDLQKGAKAGNGFHQHALLDMIERRNAAAHVPFDRSLAGRGCQAILDRQAKADSLGEAPDCERAWALYRDEAIRAFDAAESDPSRPALRGAPFKKLRYCLESPFSTGRR